MSLDRHLIHTCTIERAIVHADTYGNPSPTYGPLYSDVRCRLIEKAQRIWSSEKVASMVVTTYTLLVDGAVDLQERDQVADVRLEDGTLDERTFSVSSLLRRRTNTLQHKSAVLEAVS